MTTSQTAKRFKWLLSRIRVRVENWRQVNALKRWKKASSCSRVVVFEIERDLRVELDPNSHISPLIFSGQFEPSELQFVRKFLKPGDIFFDVGANIGLFTLVAANVVGETGSVLSFEPSASAFARLKANINLNNFANVRCFQEALSDEAGKFSMMVAQDGMDAFNSFAMPCLGDDYIAEEVAVKTWDSVAEAEKLNGRITMAKIDVEGWEGKVLRGGAGGLSRSDAPLLQVEFSEPVSAAAGVSCRDVYRQLESLGYRMYRYSAEKNKLIFDPIREKYEYSNLYGIKNLDSVVKRLEAK